MTPLRSRLIAAFAGVALLAVGIATLDSQREVSAMLQEDLQALGARGVASLRSEFAQADRFLAEELARVVDPRGDAARAHSSGAAADRYLWAAGRLEPGRLELLKILNERGQLLSSGHWPASLGALDPSRDRYLGSPSGDGIIIEPTPSGSSPSLQRWARARWGDQEVTAVLGRFLGEPELDLLRVRLQAEALAICPSSGDAPCVQSSAAGYEGPPLRPGIQSEQLLIFPVELGTAASQVLLLGLDASPIYRLQRRMRIRGLIVGLGSALLAILVASFLSLLIARPVEALATASRQLAAGDQEARVPEQPSGIREVDELVSSFNRMADDLGRSRDQLVQAERVAAWREIARGLAHELKNPLTPILGAVAVIRRARALRRDDFDEILEEQGSAVVEEVMRLKELSDAFARFARLPDPEPEPLAVDELLDSVLALYATVYEGITLRRSYPEGLPPLWADRKQLQTVLTNLVKNAVEAMDGAGTISLELRREGGTLLLAVEDNGPGIPESVREKLFTPYFTTKGSKGTGLGLALSHRIIIEHGGTIEVVDAVSGGARFEVRLPLGSEGGGGLGS